MKEKKISSPFVDRAYDISIKVEDNEDLPILARWVSTFHVSEPSRRIFFALFDLIAGECLKDNYTENIEDEFGNIVDTVFKNFNLENFDEQGSLESSIKDYIQKLEGYNYFLPNDLVKLTKERKRLKSLEFDVGFEGDLDSVLECIRDVLKALRDKKIAFWKEIFEKYKEDKEGYDLGFRTKETRRQSDLEKFSKIDIEKYKDTLGSVGKREEHNRD